MRRGDVGLEGRVIASDTLTAAICLFNFHSPPSMVALIFINTTKNATLDLTSTSVRPLPTSPRPPANFS